MIYTETLSNPTLVVADIPALAGLAHARVRLHGRLGGGNWLVRVLCVPTCSALPPPVPPHFHISTLLPSTLLPSTLPPWRRASSW